MKIYSADWVLPITSERVRHGAIVIDDENLILDLGQNERILETYRDENVQRIHFENSILMPGLVNAHTHLELSMMKGVIADELDFGDWVYEAITQRLEFPEEKIRAACRRAVKELHQTGTVAVGDIANSLSVSTDCLKEANLYAVVFNELTGFPSALAKPKLDEFLSRIPEDNSGKVRQTLAPHAAYSVSPELFELIRIYLDSHGAISTVHAAESMDETTFIRNGNGKIRNTIEKLGRWEERWRTPGVSPIAYLDALGILTNRMLAVHAVHTDDEDLEILSGRNVSVCTCPRSNVKINVGGIAPVEKYLKAGLNVCIGTDSLASNDDLNLWNEMSFFKQVHPTVPPTTILKMATINGARALRLDDQIGTIERGKENSVIRIETDFTIDEPEQFLISGKSKFRISPI